MPHLCRTRFLQFGYHIDVSNTIGLAFTTTVTDCVLVMALPFPFECPFPIGDRSDQSAIPLGLESVHYNLS
mgnify:CR=1 FL=1